MHRDLASSLTHFNQQIVSLNLQSHCISIRQAESADWLTLTWGYVPLLIFMRCMYVPTWRHFYHRRGRLGPRPVHVPADDDHMQRHRWLVDTVTSFTQHARITCSQDADWPQTATYIVLIGRRRRTHASSACLQKRKHNKPMSDDRWFCEGDGNIECKSNARQTKMDVSVSLQHSYKPLEVTHDCFGLF